MTDAELRRRLYEQARIARRGRLRRSTLMASGGGWLRRQRALLIGEQPGGGGDPEPARTMPAFVQVGTLGSVTNSANGAGFTFPAEGVVEDDLFLAAIVVNDRGGTADVNNTATGWTHLMKVPVPTNELCLSVFWRRAVGDETGAVAPFDWDAADGANDVALAQVYQFTNVDWEDGGPFLGTANSVNGDLSSLGMPSVTTEGLNGLALAVCGGTDNCTFAEPEGETGGSWVSTHGTVTTTGADDAAQRVFWAEMATPGTISGGASAITPAGTPVSSVSAAIGFALRGKLA